MPTSNGHSPERPWPDAMQARPTAGSHWLGSSAPLCDAARTHPTLHPVPSTGDGDDAIWPSGQPGDGEGSDATRTRDEAAFLRDYSAKVALVRVMARVNALLAALEARPDTEGPLEACQALVEADEGQVLTVGADEMLVMGLMADSPSLAGRLMWKIQGETGRLAVEFGRRLGLPHTELRPQLMATSVVGAFNAALQTWLSAPCRHSPDDLMRQALAHMAEGISWPAGSNRA